MKTIWMFHAALNWTSLSSSAVDHLALQPIHQSWLTIQKSIIHNVVKDNCYENQLCTATAQLPSSWLCLHWMHHHRCPFSSLALPICLSAAAALEAKYTTTIRQQLLLRSTTLPRITPAVLNCTELHCEPRIVSMLIRLGYQHR